MRMGKIANKPTLGSLLANNMKKEVDNNKKVKKYETNKIKRGKYLRSPDGRSDLEQNARSHQPREVFAPYPPTGEFVEKRLAQVLDIL